MANNLYGGIAYPQSSFVFDKICSSYTEAKSKVSTDGVLIGRYILIAYSSEAYGQNERNHLDTVAKGGAWDDRFQDTPDKRAYINNFQKDLRNAEITEKRSYDRIVFRKIYSVTSGYAYEPIMSLSSDLNDDSIIVRNILTGEEEKILTLQDGNLKTNLVFGYDETNRKIYLNGIGGTAIGSIMSESLIRSHLNNTDKILSLDSNKRLISTLALEYNDKVLTLKGKSNINNISTNEIISDYIGTGTDDEDEAILYYDNITDEIRTTLSLIYDTDQYIKLIGKDGRIISQFDASDFVKDSFLQSVGFDDITNELIFTWNTKNLTTTEIETSETRVNLYNIIDPYIGSDAIGIDTTNAELPTIILKLDTANIEQNFLTIGPNGIKLQGIVKAIEDAVAEAKNSVFVTETENLPNGINPGDIGIKISALEGIDKKEYTSYVWDGSVWKAMNGNYNATNVYLTDDLTITEDIGAQTLNGSSFKVLNTTGKNIKQVFNMLLAKEKAPSITSTPSVSVKIGDNTIPGNANITVEGGTQIIPTWSATLSSGAYSYGPATGIVATSWSVSDNRKDITGEDNNTSTLNQSTFESIIIPAGKTYKINAKAAHDAGSIAHTNLGEEYKPGNALYDEEGGTIVKIPATTSATLKSGNSPEVTGWQQGYYIGTVEDKNIEITSNILRNINDGKNILKNRKVKNANYSTQTDLSFTASGTMAKFVIAYPAAKDMDKGVYDASKGLQSFFNNTAFEEYKNNFTREIKTIAGADNDLTSIHAIDYAVWTWAPDQAFTGTINFLIDLK